MSAGHVASASVDLPVMANTGAETAEDQPPLNDDAHRHCAHCGVTTKACSMCGEWKPMDAFHFGSTADGRQSACRDCRCPSVRAAADRDRPALRARKRELRSRSPERAIRYGMIQRCHNEKNPSYEDYGARGIRVCAGWLASFDAFLDVMGPRPSRGHSVERIENGRGYDCGRCDDCAARGVTKTNCRWATKTEQNRNTRQNVLLTVNGERRCASEWARLRGVPLTLLIDRVRLGWSDEEVVLTPRRSLARSFSAAGESLPVTEWAARTGIPAYVLYKRIAAGWPADRVVTEPSRKKPWRSRMPDVLEDVQ